MSRSAPTTMPEPDSVIVAGVTVAVPADTAFGEDVALSESPGGVGKAPLLGSNEVLVTWKLLLKVWPPSLLAVPQTSSFLPAGSLRVSYQMTLTSPWALTAMAGMAWPERTCVFSEAANPGNRPPLSSLRTGEYRVRSPSGTVASSDPCAPTAKTMPAESSLSWAGFWFGTKALEATA